MLSEKPVFAAVRLLNGMPHELTYRIPDDLMGNIAIGTLVKVYVRTTLHRGVVSGLTSTPHTPAGVTIRNLTSLEEFPADPYWFSFITKISGFYRIDPQHFYQRIKGCLQSKSISIPLPINESAPLAHAPLATLTLEQRALVDHLAPHLKTSCYEPVVLHGITGAGKTEIYKHLIHQTLQAQKSVIFMVPEVSLALQFTKAFRTTFTTHNTVLGFHAASPATERRELWQKMLAGSPIIIVGVHLPVLTPIPNLGLIIVDEEHDSSFIEKKHPKLHSRDLAIWRAYHCGIPIVLGSATPSLQTMYNATTKKWPLFSVTQRYAGSLPRIIPAPLTGKEKRKFFWITRELEEKMRACLARGEQAIIFLNRRGHSFFVVCTSCGASIHCPHCSVTLTPHQKEQDEEIKELQCHYCGYTSTIGSNCKECRAGAESLITKGIGTQQIVSILTKLFPSARIARADRDTTKSQKNWSKTIKDFTDGNLDILVGTQTITKGYHFPRVTLVGIIWADLNLQMPVYNARETTLQQLIQVAGRAGRSQSESIVIAQTMRDHTLPSFMDETTYLHFLDEELVFRRAAQYPPHIKLALLELQSKNAFLLDQDATSISTILMERAIKEYPEAKILGPLRPVVHRVNMTETRHIYIKAPNYHVIHALLATISPHNYHSSLHFFPTP